MIRSNYTACSTHSTCLRSGTKWGARDLDLSISLSHIMPLFLGHQFDPSYHIIDNAFSALATFTTVCLYLGSLTVSSLEVQKERIVLHVCVCAKVQIYAWALLCKIAPFVPSLSLIWDSLTSQCVCVFVSVCMCNGGNLVVRCTLYSALCLCLIYHLSLLRLLWGPLLYALYLSVHCQESRKGDDCY